MNHPEFERVRDRMRTDEARAMVEFADRILSDVTDPRLLGEARGYITTAERMDKAAEDGDIAEALDRARRKGQTASKLDKMRVLAGGA